MPCAVLSAAVVDAIAKSLWRIAPPCCRRGILSREAMQGNERPMRCTVDTILIAPNVQLLLAPCACDERHGARTVVRRRATTRRLRWLADRDSVNVKVPCAHASERPRCVGLWRAAASTCEMSDVVWIGNDWGRDLATPLPA